MELIPSFPISKFKYLKTEEVKKLGSFILTSDGEEVCVVIVPQGESMIASYAREHAIQVAFQNNALMPQGAQKRAMEEALKGV